MANLISDAPYAWAVIPVVPIRKNPKFQYRKLKIIALIPTAPRWVADNLPIRAVSTVLSRGTEILLIILGSASAQISRLILL